jgi:hypothetical protein
VEIHLQASISLKVWRGTTLTLPLPVIDDVVNFGRLRWDGYVAGMRKVINA